MQNVILWIFALVLFGAGGFIGSWGVVIGLAGFVLALWLTSQLPQGRGFIRIVLVSVLIYSYGGTAIDMFVGDDKRVKEAYGKRLKDTTLKKSEAIRPEAVNARAILQKKCNDMEEAETFTWSNDLQAVGSGGDLEPFFRRLREIQDRRKRCEGFIETGKEGGLREAILGPKADSEFRLPELAIPPIPATVLVSVALSVLVMGLALGLIQSRGFRVAMAIAAFFVGYFYLAYIYRTRTAEVAPSMAAAYYQQATTR